MTDYVEAFRRMLETDQYLAELEHLLPHFNADPASAGVLILAAPTLLAAAQREAALRAQLDEAWGPDALVDINVEEPQDYLLVLGELMDMARRRLPRAVAAARLFQERIAELERQLAEAKELLSVRIAAAEKAADDWYRSGDPTSAREQNHVAATLLELRSALAPPESAEQPTPEIAATAPCKACDGVGWFGKPGKISLWCTACGGSGRRFLSRSEQRSLDEHGQPRPHYSLSSHGMTRCQSDCDGDCTWSDCPQLRDGEPRKTGRHCPLDREPEGD